MNLEPSVKRAYLEAATINDLEATGLPAIIHERQTDAIRDYVAPWAERHSAAAHMVYRHWADLIRGLIYGKGSSKEVARHGNPADFRALVYLEGIAALRMPTWIEQAQRIDPVKGYKQARVIAKRDLTAARMALLADPESLQVDLLERLP